jgi:hypothetical protein
MRGVFGFYQKIAIFVARNSNRIAMGVTQLKRKSRKNRTVANNKVAAIKRLTLTPNIKRVTVEELKAEAAK